MSRFGQYRALLSEQWKHQRVELAVLAIASAAAIPVTLWTNAPGSYANRPSVLLDSSAEIGIVAAPLALLVGLLLAGRPYALDSRLRHVYALSLPLPRARYALLRTVSGLTFSILPAAGFLIGAIVGAQVLPPNIAIRAYPALITVRFLLAAVLAFSVGFAVQYGLGKKAMRWVLIVAITIGSVEVLGDLALHASVTGPFWDLLSGQGSPFRLLFSRWVLFDV